MFHQLVYALLLLIWNHLDAHTIIVTAALFFVVYNVRKFYASADKRI